MMDTAHHLASLREAKKDNREAQREFREIAFNLRRMLDDPNLSNEIRASVEDQLFGVLEDLKQAEQTERDIEEGVASIGQMQSNENTESIIGMLIAVVGLIFVVFLLLR